MKTLRLNRIPLFLIMLVAVGLPLSSYAASGDIVWVTQTRDAVPADWLQIVTNAGYTVTAFTGGATPTASEIDELNAADLVIFDNSHGSNDAGTPATWNSLSVPLLTMANYPLNNWGLTSGNPPNQFDRRPPVFVPSDPMWTGVTVPLEENLFTSVRGANASIQHDGVIIAGEATGQSMHIARWGAITDGGGARLYFSGALDGADNTMNLTPLGQTVWLNAIDSLINPPTEPLLLVTVPANNAEDVIVFNDLSITFDKPVQAGTGSIALYTSDDALVESFDVESSGRLTFDLATVTIDPTATLEVGTAYYVLIDATAIESAADGSPFVGISDPTAWSFTTDGTPPEGTPLWPANGAVNMLPNTDLEINFDENVMAGSGNITVHRMSDDSVVDAIDVATAAISGSHVTFTLSGSLADGTTFYVNAPAGAFTDLSGNDWAGISDSATWNFSTVSEEATLIIWVTSARDGSIPSAWETVLNTAGYTVTGFRGSTTPTEAERARLNSADVILFDGSNGSAAAGTPSVWHGLSAPLINMGAYSTDNWGWTGGASGTSTATPAVDDADDAVWRGVEVPLTGPLFTTVRLAQAIQADKGGTTVASVGTDVAIARWPAGSFAPSGGERMFFAGANDAGSNDGKAYHLTALGEVVFLNAIASLLPPPPSATFITIQ